MRSIPKPKWRPSQEWTAADTVTITPRPSSPAGSVEYDVYFNGTLVGGIRKARYTPHKVVGRPHDFKSRWGWDYIAARDEYPPMMHYDTAGEAIVRLLDQRAAVKELASGVG